MEILKKKNEDKMAMKEFKEENRILTTDLSAISDPQIRAYIQIEQTRIMQKKGLISTSSSICLKSFWQ